MRHWKLGFEALGIETTLTLSEPPSVSQFFEGIGVTCMTSYKLIKALRSGPPPSTDSSHFIQCATMSQGARAWAPSWLKNYYTSIKPVIICLRSLSPSVITSDCSLAPCTGPSVEVIFIHSFMGTRSGCHIAKRLNTVKSTISQALSTSGFQPGNRILKHRLPIRITATHFAATLLLKTMWNALWVLCAKR